MNNFTFNNKHYLQIHGTAMGTKMPPSFANLFLGLSEANALAKTPFKPHIWLRYIDNIFMIWTGLQSWAKCLRHFINFDLNRTKSNPQPHSMLQIFEIKHRPIGKKLFQHCRARGRGKLITLDTAAALHFVNS